MAYTAKQAAQEVRNHLDWRIAYFEFVDEFLAHPSVQLVSESPELNDKKLFALLQSICCTLCFEKGIEIPQWAAKENWLESPWFVSGMNSLYASALLESPIFFRRNNIFVLENFLNRC